MLGMEVVPAVAFIGLLFTVPESPRWLARHGRDAEAHAILVKVDGPTHAETEMTAIRATATQTEPPFAALFTGGYRRPLLLAVLLAVFQQFCGINAIMYYSTKIFETAGALKNAAFTSSVWVGLINFVFTFVAIAFVDRLGRRPLLLIGTAVQAVSLGLVGWMFHTHQNGIALLLCVVAFIAAFAMAMGPITWLFCSEIFPNQIRGRAMSVAAFTVWVACYIVAQTFPMLNDSPSVGPAITFWLYAAVSLASLFFVLALIPETKGRTLEEIGRMWTAVKAAPEKDPRS
jgi:MFS transporter, SP family, arabinose:H+ symporter